MYTKSIKKLILKIKIQEPMDARIFFRLTRKEHEKFKKLAIKNKVQPSDLAREIIRKYI